MLYVALVLLGMMARNRSLIIIAAILGSTLNLLGYFFSPPGGDLVHVITNRALAFLIICVTAILCLLRHRADEKLESARNFLETKVEERTGKLKEANQRLNKEAESAELVKAIAMASNETRAIKDTLHFCIEKVSRFADWPLGHLYLKAEKPSSVLIYQPHYHLQHLVLHQV